MTFLVRRAEPRDLPSLGRLGVTLMRAHHAFDPLRFLPPTEDSESGYGRFLVSVLRSEDGNVLVAVDENNAVLGYVYMTLEPMSWMELRGPAGFIQDIVVDESARRSGVATALMNAALEWLREHDAPRVMLWTAAPNAAAQSFFRRFGFRDTMIEMTREW